MSLSIDADSYGYTDKPVDLSNAFVLETDESETHEIDRFTHGDTEILIKTPVGSKGPHVHIQLGVLTISFKDAEAEIG